ncbi:hypothetical protein [Halobacillus karajensis]|uniref:hypothetical protein n=1 Tax=Halobacillus karajensis TaxID=195088 RepID=UPI00045C7283|nr:hypothetical protein [Halobacillus karajensis]CDQ21679.1 hypothetical protein BN982_04088 [Halobacillus karajensis]
MKVLEKFGIKRIPPIAYPFLLPLVIPAVAVYGLYLAGAWLLGFKRCDKCRKLRGITVDIEKRYEPYGFGHIHTTTECSVCKQKEKEERESQKLAYQRYIRSERSKRRTSVFD